MTLEDKLNETKAKAREKLKELSEVATGTYQLAELYAATKGMELYQKYAPPPLKEYNRKKRLKKIADSIDEEPWET